MAFIDWDSFAAYIRIPNFALRHYGMEEGETMRRIIIAAFNAAR
jgi:hypothetical protein